SEQKESVTEAVEELQYRCSLKIALDILHQTDSGSQMPPAEGTNPEFSGEESAPPTPPRSFFLRSRFKKSESPAAKRKRKPQNNCGLKDDPKARSQGGSVVPKGSGKAPGGGTNPSRAPGGGTNPSRTRGGGTNPARCRARDSCVAPAPASQNCKKPEPKSSPRQRKIQPKTRNGVSCKPKAGRSQQGRKRGCRDESPQDRAQVAPEEGSPPAPSKSGTVEPSRKTGTQPGRTFLDSSCETASDELEKSISSESESLAKQLDGRREAEGGKHLDETGVASGTDRKCRNHPGSSPGPSGAFPQPQEEENQDPSHLAGNKAPDSEEDEGKFPFFFVPEPKFFEGGMLVWCKLRRYPYWPAVVKAVKRKHRRACVLFIDGTTNEKKKGFSVSLKSLKHFDCEEKQELIEQAKENYSKEIEWCLQLILDYRIRVGCHSFAGSFLEYFAADISYPVRKEGYQSVVQMAFPNTEEVGAGEPSSDSSPQKPPRKLLPDRTRAARDRENKKLVEFIVKTKGAEEHLLGILKSGKESRWLKKFLSSSRYMTCVETYLEDEEQLDLVVGYLKEVYREMDTKNLHQILGDGIRFISDVLLPEAIICAIAAVDDIDYEKAEEKYIKGPPVSKR
ncbi:MUM1 protein, partial [Pomatorhinus ruficollis]|nr:MUM1 protein [Pomatorhinus ruficollis]